MVGQQGYYTQDTGRNVYHYYMGVPRNPPEGVLAIKVS